MERKFAIIVETRDSTEPDCLSIEDVVNTLFDNFDRAHVSLVMGRDDTSGADAIALRPSHIRSE